MDSGYGRRALQYALALASLLLVSGCDRMPDSRPTAKIPQIGFMIPGPESIFSSRVDEFRRGLRELGYVEGQSIIVDYRYLPDGNLDGLPAVANDFVQRNVDVIVTVGDGLRVARAATSTIPIVFASVSDPVGAGLVASLASPGGNVTGITNLSEGIDAKRLEILKEIVPNLQRVAHFWQPSSPRGPFHVAAEGLGLDLFTVEIQSAEDIDRGFESAHAKGAEALVMSPSPLFITHRSQIIELAARYRLPGMYPSGGYPEQGGLMRYGQGESPFFRSASFVDRILKGAKPGDLPVEQPTTFDFTINLTTAQSLGLTIPASVLAQATQIIP